MIKQAAKILRQYSLDTSLLKFSSDDKFVKKVVSNIIHSCRSNLQRTSSTFNKNFNIQELHVTVSSLNLNKSPGSGGIHAPMIQSLKQIGKQRFLDNINDFWKRGRLPREGRKAFIISVKNPSKESTSRESYRPISLICISFIIMDKIILKSFNYYLNINNLLP